MDRRQFLAGIATSLVAAGVPIPVSAKLPPGFDPRFRVSGPATLENLYRGLIHIFGEVQRLPPNLSSEDRSTVDELVGEAISWLRPVGVLVKLNATGDRIASGKFTVTEPHPGLVEVS